MSHEKLKTNLIAATDALGEALDALRNAAYVAENIQHGEQQGLRRHTFYTVVKRGAWFPHKQRYLYPSHPNTCVGALWDAREAAEAAARNIGGIVAEVTFYDV